MLTDVLVSSTWRTGKMPPIGASRARERQGGSSGDEQRPLFRTQAGRHTVTLTQDESSFIVRVTSKGVLFGPPVPVYEATHPNRRYACLDVMARVIRATGDESLGVQAGRDAAGWMKTLPMPMEAVGA